MKNLIKGIIVLVILISVLTLNLKLQSKERNGKIFIDNYNVYGESLNISYNENFANTFIFKNIKSKEETIIETTDNINEGINPNSLEEGEYNIYSEALEILSIEEDVDITYYTITRNDINYKVTLNTDSKDHLIYSKTKSELPDDQYDIIIDPGHGGVDVGAIATDGITYEKDINLSVANYLYELLSTAGYKVALTRSDDILPGDCENANPYCEGGRIDKVYESNAKLTISLHSNSGGGFGFEIYDSSFTSHTFANEVVNSLLTNFEASTKETDMSSIGVYNPIEDGVDYYYMVRETGGVATKGDSEENLDNSSSKIGSESILIELGYLDNYTQFLQLTNVETQQELAQLIFTAIDTYINNI